MHDDARDAARRYTAHEIRTIAVRARRDPRTVAAVLDGRRCTDLARLAVEEAARELGLIDPRANEEGSR
jgi:hypothetical protein